MSRNHPHGRLSVPTGHPIIPTHLIGRSEMHTWRRTVLTVVLFGAMTAPSLIGAQAGGARRPRVLITNDNGIGDPKIVALARAFAPHAETWVIAPATNQSGTGSHLSVTREGK